VEYNTLGKVLEENYNVALDLILIGGLSKEL
jgi:hypothetical protein